jgi:hypothetical protein
MPGCADYSCDNSTTKSIRLKEVGAPEELSADNEERNLRTPTTEDWEQIKLLFSQCCIHDAPLIGAHLKYFKFPNDVKTRNKWIELCGRLKKDIGPNSCLCSEHFPKNAYNMQLLVKHNFKLKGLRLLKSDALPSLKLNTKSPKTLSKSQLEREKRMTKKRLNE